MSTPTWLARVGALFPLLLAGCLAGTSEDTFIGGRAEMMCGGQFPACKGQFGGCTLDSEHYIKGTFPSSKKILVTTPLGEYKIRLNFFLEDRLAPGTETEISWYEIGCADQYRYQLSKHIGEGDLFEQAGRTQVFSVERPVITWGDHLIEFWSDATCRYDLRIEVLEIKK
jgi:hypothetical protein